MERDERNVRPSVRPPFLSSDKCGGGSAIALERRSVCPSPRLPPLSLVPSEKAHLMKAATFKPAQPRPPARAPAPPLSGCCPPNPSCARDSDRLSPETRNTHSIRATSYPVRKVRLQRHMIRDICKESRGRARWESCKQGGREGGRQAEEGIQKPRASRPPFSSSALFV